MKQRLISAFFGIILFAAVILSRKEIINIAVVIVSVMAIYELLCALGLKKFTTMLVLGMIFPVFVYINGFINFIEPVNLIFAFAALLYVLKLLFHEKCSFSDSAMCFFATILITFSFTCISAVRCGENGLANVILIFFGSWITDSCAYFTGVFLGKHKLSPVISPKKTIEGAIGGVLGTAIILFAYAYAVSYFTNIDLNYLSVIVLGIICGIVSQIGDLCASAVKREYGIKDYGNLMPGHGGVLDRFDSILLVAPVVYIYISKFAVFI